MTSDKVLVWQLQHLVYEMPMVGSFNFGAYHSAGNLKILGTDKLCSTCWSMCGSRCQCSDANRNPVSEFEFWSGNVAELRPQAMAEVYMKILDKIVDADYDVMSSRIRLSRRAKLSLTARFWLRSRLSFLPF